MNHYRFRIKSHDSNLRKLATYRASGLTFNVLNSILSVPLNDTASIAPANLKVIALYVIQLGVGSAASARRVVASFHSRRGVPIASIRSQTV
ncbi:lytic polysaccharide monooxygenase [Alternaria alternata]|nr:lytic polysaccharide monooxygenase [Alternaria alternata]